MESDTFPAPFDRHAETVRPEWIDYNGHMNVAFYVLAFDHATDAFFEAMGFGAEWRARAGRSFFAVEGHIRYLAELRAGETLAVATTLLAADEKRIRFFHAMRAGDGRAVAQVEFVALQVDLATRRTAAFAPDDVARLAAVLRAHAGLQRPADAGRGIERPPLREGAP
jgi:acyl-CoA thioester hydrolase